MVQNIRDELNLSKGYRIDEQFMVCLHDIVSAYDKDVIIKIDVLYKKTKFSFDGVDEFIENTSVFTEQIQRMEIKICFKRQNNYSYDEVNIAFNNESEFALGYDKVSFNFNDPKGFYVLKNKYRLY